MEPIERDDSTLNTLPPAAQQQDVQTYIPGSQHATHQSAVEVHGGNFQTAHFGPQTQNVKVIKKDKTVHHDYSNAHIGEFSIHYHQQGNPPESAVGAEATIPSSDQTQPDWIELKGSIRMFFNQKLGGRHNIFHGEQSSEVIGVRLLAIKSLPFCKIHIREANLLKDLKHQNVVGVIHSDSFMLGPMKKMYIAMERCNDKNLFDYVLEKKRQNLSFDCQTCILQAKQIVDGLQYIHSQKIIHRDLKPHNILLSLCGRFLKIADFGLSKAMTSGRSVTAASISRVGTDGYRAPETYNSAEISQLADVFSLGLTLFFILSYGGHPFGTDPDSWNHYIKNGRKRLDLSGLMVEDIANAVDLFERMLQRIPKNRPTADEVLKHLFFASGQPSGGRHRSTSASQQAARVSASSFAATENQMFQFRQRGVPSSESDRRRSGPTQRLNSDLPSSFLVTEAQMHPFGRPSSLHASESAPIFPAIEPQEEFPSAFSSLPVNDWDFIDSTLRSELDDPFQDTKGRSQSVDISITLLPPPPEYPRRRRAITSSPVPITSTRIQPASTGSSPISGKQQHHSRPTIMHTASADSSPSGHRQRQFCPMMVHAVSVESSPLNSRQRQHRTTTIQAPSEFSPSVLSNAPVISRRRPLASSSKDQRQGDLFSKFSSSRLSLPDNVAVGELQEPMVPHVLHAGKNTCPNPNSLLVFDKPSRAAMKFEPQTKSWSKVHEIPDAITGQHFTAVVVQKHVYILAADGSVFRLTFLDQDIRWDTMPRMKRAHGERPPAAVLNGEIYALGSAGGSSLHLTSEVEKFTSWNNQWLDEKPMINQRYHHAVVAAGGCIYCIGGQSQTTLGSVDKYSPSKNQWSSVKQMNQSRIYPAAAEYKGNIYVMGGFRASNHSCTSKLSSVEFYDISKDSWTIVVHMSKPRAMFSACVVNEMVFAVGGVKKGFHQEKKTIEYFDVSNGKWKLIHVPKDIKMDNMSAVAIAL